MTVKEMIEELKKLPPNMEVRIHAPEFDQFGDEDEIPEPTVILNKDFPDVVWLGWY